MSVRFEINNPESERPNQPTDSGISPGVTPGGGSEIISDVIPSVIPGITPSDSPNDKSIDSSINSLNETPQFPIDFIDREIIFGGGPKKRTGLRLALWTWLSASIDGLVLFSLSCFFMVFFSFLMKTSAKSFLNFVFSNKTSVETFILLFLITSWSYLIFSRVFMGASIGERSCDLRLGQPTQRFQANYILKVILRSTIVVLTGVFVLPLLSVIFRRDLAGDLAGVKIYSLQ